MVMSYTELTKRKSRLRDTNRTMCKFKSDQWFKLNICPVNNKKSLDNHINAKSWFKRLKWSAEVEMIHRDTFPSLWIKWDQLLIYYELNLLIVYNLSSRLYQKVAKLSREQIFSYQRLWIIIWYIYLLGHFRIKMVYSQVYTECKIKL